MTSPPVRIPADGRNETCRNSQTKIKQVGPKWWRITYRATSDRSLKFLLEGCLAGRGEMEDPDALLSSLICVPALFLYFLSCLSVFIYNPCIYSSHKHPLICGRRLCEDGNGRTQTTSQRSLPLLTGSVYHCLPNLQADAAWPPGPDPRVWTWQRCLY